MNIIGFSHNYTKLCGQTWGTLLSVEEKCLSLAPDPVGIEYDTEYLDGASQEKKHFPLSESSFEKPMLQLVFIGNHDIPFTTYREVPKEYIPTYPLAKTRTYVPYSDLIGKSFAFKLKGEKLPESIQKWVDTSEVKPVKIFD